MDSVRGTVVVAGQTVGATAIVLPAWWYSFDVVHRTASGAETAKDALLSVHPELLVSNQVLVVVAANHVGKGMAPLTNSSTLRAFCATRSVI